MRSLIFIFSIWGIVFTLSNCADKSQPTNKSSVQAPINPNGDSELALLMREMFDEGMKVRNEIKHGGTPSIMKKFEQIHSAVPTEEGKNQSDIYKSFAKSYVNALDALSRANTDNAKERFNFMVDNCMGCHQAICPGPTVRIKKLYLK